MKWIYVVIAILFAGLFVGGPGPDSIRTAKETWDLGHILLFAAAAYVFSRNIPRRLNRGAAIAAVASACLAAAILTESLQPLVGRSFEWKDLGNDLLGGYLGWALAEIGYGGHRRPIRIALTAVGLILLLRSCTPLIRALVDDAAIRLQAPVLSDFETPFECDRWKSRQAVLRIDRARVRHGRGSLRAELSCGDYAYPGITLTSFHRNWQDYSRLRFSVYNPQAQTLALQIRIHDRRHSESGFAHSDRYNEQLDLSPGWNDITLSLAWIHSAPRGRDMDMKEISAVGLFMERPDHPVTLYLDWLRLEQ